MPLVFIHGVRQRSEAGLERLQTQFVDMLEAVRKRTKLPDNFDVRVPYWGDLGARPGHMDIIPFAYASGVYRGATRASISTAPQNGDAFTQLLRICGGDKTAVVRILREMAGQAALSQDERAAFESLLASDPQQAYAEYCALAQGSEYEVHEAAPAPLTRGAQREKRSVLAKRTALQRFGDFVERSVSHSLLAMPMLLEAYANTHRNFALFVGDAMEYVIQRERHGAHGPILQTVLEAVPTQRSPDEPLIVITHSMGGSIFYDILTTYRPDLEVDCWISVGSQVAMFQTLGFLANQAGLEREPAPAPKLVAGLKPRVKQWYNIFDPLDPLNFVASTVFADAKDVPFETGSGPLRSHSWYFREARFYELVADQIVEALSGGTASEKRKV